MVGAWQKARQGAGKGVSMGWQGQVECKANAKRGGEGATAGRRSKDNKATSTRQTGGRQGGGGEKSCGDRPAPLLAGTPSKRQGRAGKEPRRCRGPNGL